MPIPCTNCIRFHYGQCYEAVKNCYECGGANHIDRYCPNKKNFIQRVPGQPLAGTIPWQELHGLHHDSDLRFKVLQSLKTSPGTAIHVNGVCIYPGHEKHFVKEEDRGRSSGRSLFDRIGKRSASPVRLSRSPPRGPRYDGYRGGNSDWDRGQSPPRRANNGYRQRSPIRRGRRRTPSPYRHASPPSFYNQGRPLSPRRRPLSPRRSRQASPPSSYYPRRAAEDEDDVVFLSERHSNFHDRKARQIENFFRVDVDKMDYTPEIPTAPRALREISANVPKVLAPTPSKTNQVNVHVSPIRTAETVNDPYFVLGVTKSAGDAAILQAFQDRMREVESEKALEIDMDEELANDYANSIRLLQTAKSQLLGGWTGFVR